MLTRAQAFKRLREKVELSGLQERTVATRQATVRAALEGQITVADTFLTGSYRRQTLIGPAREADVDIAVVLNRTYRTRGPDGVLNLVKRALEAAYPGTSAIKRSTPAVTIRFSDFIVDVVPMFATPWWSWNDGWEICDLRNDGWVITDPKRHVAMSARANRTHHDHLVPRIKQLKAWNRTVNRPLRSFHLEALAWSIFGTSWWWHETIKSDWQSASYFFDKAREKLRRKLSDPAGQGADVGAYLAGTALEEAVSKMDTALQRCLKAEQAAKEDDMETTHAAYRKVFGNYYPA